MLPYRILSLEEKCYFASRGKIDTSFSIFSIIGVTVTGTQVLVLTNTVHLAV